MTSRERSGFIGKERDNETGLGDFGVRKYDFLAGRFTSPDPLWEKYASLTPYQYCDNNPISRIDDNGKLMLFVNGYNGTCGQIGYSKKDEYGFANSGQYWGGTATKLMNRVGDKNALFVNGSDNEISSAMERYYKGISTGVKIANDIESGKIKLDANETIKLVSHSQGSAEAAGISRILINAGYKVEVSMFLYWMNVNLNK